MTEKIRVKLHPGAKKVSVTPPAKGSADLWEVWVRAPAVEGKANAALIEALADWLDCPKSQITLLQGRTSRLKTLTIPKRS